MSVEEHREEVHRVLHSAQFRRAPKLQQFLTLICEYHFENKSQDINEFLIATKAFGKGPGFDPGQDSLVRVQAREVRRRLREYYREEGRNSRVTVDIPVGGYAPIFSTPDRGPRPLRLSPFRMAWGMLVLTALGCAAILLMADHERRIWVGALNSGSVQAATGAATPLVSRLWNRFLDSDSPTVLVLSNPDVGECASSGAGAVTAGAAKPTPCPDEYTGMGEAVAINLISNIFEARNKTLIVKQSRMVNEDDVKRYNLILLGGKKVNAWTQRLGGDLSLTADSESLGHRYETAFDGKTGQLISDRGVIALRRHRATGHWLLFLYGKHTQGTHAAAEGSTNERFLAQLRWPASVAPVPDNFKVLVGVAVNDGIPEGPIPVALYVP